MKQTELDESLLTAYLDDELSLAERELVEKRLKTDEGWQQLLSELESVRLLIRTLPSPMLSRPIADGPWNSSASKTDEDTHFVKNPIPSSALGVFYQLALAASLLVGVFATISWLRTDRESFQIAKSNQESSSKALPSENKPSSASAPSEVTATSTEGASSAIADTIISESRKNTEAVDFNIGMKLEESNVAKKSELAKEVDIVSKPEESTNSRMGFKAERMLPERAADLALVPSAGTPVPSMKPSSAATRSELPRQLEQNELQMQAPVPKSDATLPASVETYYAKQKKLSSPKDKSSLREAAGAFSGTENQLFTFFERISNPEQPIAKYLWKPRDTESAIAVQTSPSLTFSDKEQYELFFQRSEWPMVATELGKLGIQLPSPKSVGDHFADEGVDRFPNLKLDNTLPLLPPTLLGAIDEPTDWVRVIVTVESR